MNQQLLDYIKQCSVQGIAETQISETLIKAGWKKEDVSEALKSVLPKTAPVIAPVIASVKPDQFKPLGQSKPVEQKGLIKPASQANQTAQATKPNSVNSLKQFNEAKSKKSFQAFFNRKNKYFIIIVSIVVLSLLSAGVYAFIKGYLFPSKQAVPINLENKVVIATSSVTENQVDNNGNANTASSSLATSSLATSSVSNSDIIADVSSSSLTVSSIVIHQPGVTVNNPASGTVISYDGAAAAALDSDNDGLTDAEEKIYGTDPHNPDTDGDGYLDGAEVKAGYNPLGAGKLVK